MLVALDVIQHKHTAITGREAFDSFFQNDSVDISGKMAVFSPEVLLQTIWGIRSKMNAIPV
jgi:hypothetical protein